MGYNGFYHTIFNTDDYSCMYNDEQCKSSIFDIQTFCEAGDNMLTEDVCYNWYVYSVYPNASTDQTYYNRNAALDTMKNACNKYKHNQKCTCINVIKDNAAKSFTFASDPSKGYSVSCIYEACSKADMSYDPANPKPYLPDEIANGDISCPKNLCSIAMNDTTVNITGGGTLNLANECGFDNVSNDSNNIDKEEKVEEVTETVEKVESSESLLNNIQKILIIIVIVSVCLIVILLIVLISVKSSVNKISKNNV